jgi:hypothetical protein
MTTVTGPNQVRGAIVRMLTKSAVGRSAPEVVEAVAREAKVSDDEVRTQMRILLESGRIVLGQNLNLVARKMTNAG